MADGEYSDAFLAGVQWALDAMGADEMPPYPERVEVYFLESLLDEDVK